MTISNPSTDAPTPVAQTYGSTSVGNNSYTAANLDTTAFDVGSLADTSNDRLTLPAGYFQLSAYASYAANGTGIRYLAIARNGVVVADQFVTNATGFFSAGLTVTSLIHAAASDHITATLYQNSGGSLTTTCRLSAAQLA